MCSLDVYDQGLMLQSIEEGVLTMCSLDVYDQGLMLQSIEEGV
jgi:hypothetical protein